jgi:mono/diheme cytochrome c family protein
MGCHRADGGGTEGVVPPLAGSVGRFVAVPRGRAFLVQVPGTSQAPLSDADIAALLNWLLPEFSRAELPADFVPYTAEEVARYRQTPLTDVSGVRRELLAAIEAVH